MATAFIKPPNDLLQVHVQAPQIVLSATLPGSHPGRTKVAFESRWGESAG
jgi:hypothetical protein